jgi:hypothetical protein
MKLAEKIKRRIAKLMDNDFMVYIFNKNLPKHYPDFKEVISLELQPFKKHLGITSAVFVVEYKIKYKSKDNHDKKLDIFASAHSDGSREGAYKKTKELYKKGFDKGKYRVTRPLFFLADQKAFIYVASPGQSFFNFLSQDPQANLEASLKLAAGWVKKLHNLEFDQKKFEWGHFSIDNMVPSPKIFLVDFMTRDKDQGRLVADLVKDMKARQKKLDAKIKKTIVYGDYHPENIIIHDLEADYLEMIDFTDISTGDPMMDLGNFLQQLDFMGHNFISRKKINDYKEYFVSAYFEKDLDQVAPDFFSRINLYQSWAALRTAVFLFYKKDVENPVTDLLKDSINYLKLSQACQKQINLYHE